MAKERTIDGLRDLLFSAAERLETATPEQLDAELLRAKAIGDLGKVLVDTARVEVQREKATGQQGGSRFLPAAPKGADEPPGEKTTPRLVGKT